MLLFMSRHLQAVLVPCWQFTWTTPAIYLWVSFWNLLLYFSSWHAQFPGHMTEWKFLPVCLMMEGILNVHLVSWHSRCGFLILPIFFFLWQKDHTEFSHSEKSHKHPKEGRVRHPHYIIVRIPLFLEEQVKQNRAVVVNFLNLPHIQVRPSNKEICIIKMCNYINLINTMHY